MPRPFDVVRARRAVADMRAIGSKAAAKKHKVTERTLFLWQRKLQDAALAEVKSTEVVNSVLDAVSGPGVEWRKKLRATLSVGLERLAKIAAKETDPDKLSRAIGRLAELEVTAEALGVGSASSGEGSESASDAEAPSGKSG